MISEQTICALVAMAAITTLELYALHKGINGRLMCLTVAVIAGLGGFLCGNMIPGIYP